jgi:hypothetical protein
MGRTTWISEADDDEKGSFSSTESKHTYENTDIFGASKAESEALERNESAVWLDSSVNDADVYEVSEDQRFNVTRTESDSQGRINPPAHGPGR